MTFEGFNSTCKLGVFVEKKADKIAVLPFVGSLAFSVKYDMKFSKY